ncbi:hypothetical protein AB2L28_01735 [Kineococcus sp. TBRC 1896]|uniref:Uncharacterized protein n=1 Tax=Kineococcus mangrovi TaxID=1660183 RepID=A0ABV4HX04_9ACTN
MSTTDELGAPDPRRTEFSRLLALQTDRIRGLPLTRLDRVRPGEESSAADVVRAAAQDLADLAADAEGQPRRTLPVLATHGLGDQLAVLGTDVLRHGDDAALAAAHEVLTRVRRAL